MQAIKQYIQNLSVRQLMILAILLCLPAFLINLGLMGFIGDEGIRSLVAFEMKLSGNFIVPTLNGEEYFNKPPLFNWFIFLMSSAFGYFGEWPSRLTTLVFLGCYGVSVYYFVRKQFDTLTALTMALMALTSGRILFWDSMLGLIDICFSWIIFLNFMILYTLAKKQQWRKLFIISYLLFSVAFLLKGLPAAVFQGISIITALQLHGALRRKLFSTDHLLGIGLGIIPVISYYALYASQVSLEHVFSILLDQSMQRTVTHHGIGKTILHLFTFPLRNIYDFMPWSLLVIFCFHPRFLAWIRSHDFIRFNFWMLLTNLPVYWISVQVYPRYLLMFIPLFNMVGYFILQRSLELNQKWWNTLRFTFLSLTALGVITVILMPLDARVRYLPGMPYIWILGALGLAICLWCLIADARRTFLWFAITVLMVRIIFDVVILPIRASDHQLTYCRESCRRVADTYGEHTWYWYGETFPHEVARFYASFYSYQIIRKTDTVSDPEGYYLVDKRKHPDFPGVQVDSLFLESAEVISLMTPLP